MAEFDEDWDESGENSDYAYEPLPSHPSDEDDLFLAREALRSEEVDEIAVHAFCEDAEPRLGTSTPLSDAMASRAPSTSSQGPWTCRSLLQSSPRWQ